MKCGERQSAAVDALCSIYASSHNMPTHRQCRNKRRSIHLFHMQDRPAGDTQAVQYSLLNRRQAGATLTSCYVKTTPTTQNSLFDEPAPSNLCANQHLQMHRLLLPTARARLGGRPLSSWARMGRGRTPLQAAHGTDNTSRQ
jgi:hypothetical protein